MRIAYARINQESNAFSPLATTLEDFERLHYKEGEELADACRFWNEEIAGLTRFGELTGFVRTAQRMGATTVPLLSAWSMAGGPLTDETADTLADRLVSRLERALPVDGVYLALHGACAGSDPDDTPEHRILRRVREAVGDAVPIAASYDLHGHMSWEKLTVPDVITAYQTNPHWDLYRTGKRAARALVRSIAGEVRPVVRYRSLPMVLGGGNTVDFLSPMRKVFAYLRDLEKRPGVLSANLFMVHTWLKVGDPGWAVVVVTDGDEALADRLADDIADRAWNVREKPMPRFLPADEAIDAARAAGWRRRTGAVYFADASDVVGAGGTGENTHLPRELLKRATDMTSFAALRDAAFVEQFWETPKGSTVQASLGGHVDPATNPPLPVQGRLADKRVTSHFGRGIRLDLGHVQLIVTERAPFALKPSFFTDFGLRMRDADIVVVKSLFHFLMFHAPFVRAVHPVTTSGITDLSQYENNALIEPVHPMTRLEDWRPADRARRARYEAGRASVGKTTSSRSNGIEKSRSHGASP